MPSLIVQLAETVVRGGVRAAHGDPIETPSGTLVPVSVVLFGVGGGGDSRENGGGGGGGLAVPLGAYDVRPERTRFIPNPVVLLWIMAGVWRLALRRGVPLPSMADRQR